MSKTEAITEILDRARLGKPIEVDQFEAALFHWRKITQNLDLPRYQTALVTFLTRNGELGSLISEAFRKSIREDEGTSPNDCKFVSVGEMEGLRRSILVQNLSEVIFFAEDLPIKLASISTESRKMAREMLAILLLESCYANKRQYCLNFRTDELAESLYPELKGKLARSE